MKILKNYVEKEKICQIVTNIGRKSMKYVGIDIGGTQLRTAIFDEKQRMIECFKTKNDSELSARANVDKLINFIMCKEYQYGGIGIGCPGPLDAKNGRILTPPNLKGWDYFEISDYVKQKTGVKTVLNNDANLAGVAEATLGTGKGYNSVVFVGISTGIGGAYIYQGKLVNGANSNAAEIWNMIVSEDQGENENINKGTLNERSSGRALAEIAQKAYGRKIDSKQLFELYNQNDSIAEKIVGRAADILAKGIANITCVVDPDIIVVGGSVALNNPSFVNLIIKNTNKYVLFPGKLKIELASFGDDAGVVGAALLAMEEVKNTNNIACKNNKIMLKKYINLKKLKKTYN